MPILLADVSFPDEEDIDKIERETQTRHRM